MYNFLDLSKTGASQILKKLSMLYELELSEQSSKAKAETRAWWTGCAQTRVWGSGMMECKSSRSERKAGFQITSHLGISSAKESKRIARPKVSKII